MRAMFCICCERSLKCLHSCRNAPASNWMRMWLGKKVVKYRCETQLSAWLLPPTTWKISPLFFINSESWTACRDVLVSNAILQRCVSKNSMLGNRPRATTQMIEKSHVHLLVGCLLLMAFLPFWVCYAIDILGCFIVSERIQGSNRSVVWGSLLSQFSWHVPCLHNKPLSSNEIIAIDSS